MLCYCVEQRYFLLLEIGRWERWLVEVCVWLAVVSISGDICCILVCFQVARAINSEFVRAWCLVRNITSVHERARIRLTTESK